MINFARQLLEGETEDRTFVNINQLEYFVTVMECGNFSMAAKRLFVTPQAVSKSIGDLERELHVQLCEKTGRSIEPTAFGRVFSLRASEVLSCLADLETLAKRQSQAQSQEGAISLAVAHSTCRGNVLKDGDFSLFRKTYPRIELSVSFRASGACLAAVEDGAVDAAVILGRANREGLTCIKLHSIPPHVMLSERHPLASKKSLTLEDLRGVPIAEPEDLRCCRSTVTEHFRAKGIEPLYVPLDPTPARQKDFLDKERGAMFVVADPSLRKAHPASVVRPVAPEDIAPVPLCFVRSNNDGKPLLHLEHYLLGTATRLRRKRA